MRSSSSPINPLHSATLSHLSSLSRVLHDDGLQTLGFLLLDVDGLDVAVQLLLGAFFVVTLSADAHAQSVGDALDAGLPHLLVQLWVETHINGSLDTKKC